MSKKIKPAYVTYDQAVWLKKRGFDIDCNYFYVTPKSKIFGIDEHNRYYPRKNISKQLHKIGDCTVLNIKNFISAPEQWLVIEWLRVNHGIWIYVLPHSTLFRPYAEELIDKDRFGKWEGHKYNNPQEAYSAAFDYIISNNLI
jgi:hypothetical protein